MRYSAALCSVWLARPGRDDAKRSARFGQWPRLRCETVDRRSRGGSAGGTRRVEMLGPLALAYIGYEHGSGWRGANPECCPCLLSGHPSERLADALPSPAEPPTRLSIRVGIACDIGGSLRPRGNRSCGPSSLTDFAPSSPMASSASLPMMSRARFAPAAPAAQT